MALHEFIRERLMVSLNGGIKEYITVLRIKACPQTDQRGGQYVREDRNARSDHRDRCGMAVR